MILLRIIVFPLALIYGSVVHIRNYFYDSGILKSRKFDIPTVCVGNLSLGGTGKSPMVEFLIARLRETHTIAVLSRGYKRKSTGFVLATRESTVGQLGDEPFQFHSKFEDIVVAVDTDRCHGIEMLQKQVKPDLIILDDAYQHRKVAPSFSMLLTTFDKPYYNDYFIPTGTLRDSRNQAVRADLIVVTKCPLNITESQKKAMVKELRPEPGQKVLFSYLEYGNTVKGAAEEVGLDRFKGKKLNLVTGIADPEALVVYLEQQDLDFEHLRFKDHHAFTKKEIENLNSMEWVLTTEKDFARLQGRVKNLYYIEIAHKFFGSGGEELRAAVEMAMKQNS